MSDSDRAIVSVRERREQVIQQLSEHFARDTIDMDEFDERLDHAHQATAITALDRLLEDLPPLETRQETTALAPAHDVALDASRPARKHVIAAMGGVQRKGSWLVPRDLRVIAAMGGVTLDFREARLPPGVTAVHVMALMGGVEIIVPPHIAVQAEGLAIMGGFEDMHRAPASPEPDTPVLEISGFALMGGVEIFTRLPGESRRQARRRERRERRALDAAHRKQLRGR